MLKSLKKFYQKINKGGADFDIDLFSRPQHVCLDVSNVCQLKCVSCPNTNKTIKKVLGSGVMTFENYQRFIEAHPWITKVELSNWGEVFLNPELKNILEYSFKRNILLFIDNGANLNTVSEEVLEALVKYKVQSLSCSIDGASQETYSIYRVNGNYNQVIKNIRKINEFKKHYNSYSPGLKWQFVAFGHNEHEIKAARELADSLGMKFHLKLSWDDLYGKTFSPILNKEIIRVESGLGVADRKEFEEKYKRNYVDRCCSFFFNKPHINFDGKLLGCGINHWADFGNVFHEGIENCIKGERYQYTRQILMGLRPERKDIPCIHCKIYNFRKTHNNYITDEQLKKFPF